MLSLRTRFAKFGKPLRGAQPDSVTAAGPPPKGKPATVCCQQGAKVKGVQGTIYNPKGKK